jgi:dTDP-glucose pyrophosphorylase
MTNRLGRTERLQACLVRDDGTIADAMRSIDRGAGQIALAVDADGRLVGVITDGDVRRALLGGASLEQPLAAVVTREFVAVREGEHRAAATELMRARRIDAIPVVDADGRPVGLHLLHEFLEPVERTNWAVVMAGGQGQRLRPLTNDLPKPMLRVAGRPILERLVLHLVGFGIKRIFVSVNYLGHVIEEHFGDGEAYGCRIEYLREDAPLGTAGSLTLLPATPNEPLLVLNGDLVTSADLGKLLDTHVAGGYAATLGIYRYLHTVPFGCVDRDGARIVALDEKPTIVRDVNSGIYALDPSALARLEPGVPSTMPALVDRLLEAGEPVGAFDIDEDWIDVGHRDQLARAQDGG